MKRTTYHQTDIRPILIKHLANATKSIRLAVGWLEDDGLISLLEKKAAEGIKVSLLLVVTEKEKNQFPIFKRLKEKGIEIVKMDDAHREHLIDHKFGIIDASIILTGNYGWGNKNAPREDTLTVTEELPTLTAGFEREYEYLSVVNDLPRQAAKPANETILLLKKMQVVKVLLEVGDTDYIHLRADELEKFTGDENTHQIIELLRQKSYEEALELIKPFIQYHRALRECVDPPVDSLRREIRLLEEEIAATSNKFNETQKALHKFSKMHTDSLGELLQKILFQNKQKAKIEAQADADKKGEYEEAKKDHEEYTKSHEVAKQAKLKVLTPQEQKQLKKLYRQTSLKCHPDRVVDELHDQAEEIFVALNQAYRANDLEQVIQINQQLKEGIMLTKSEGITELKKLESSFKNLSQKLQSWQQKLTELELTPSYQTIHHIADWDVYFSETKTVLEKQLEQLIAFNKLHSPTNP